jgi:hypothetical protein
MEGLYISYTPLNPSEFRGEGRNFYFFLIDRIYSLPLISRVTSLWGEKNYTIGYR